MVCVTSKKSLKAELKRRGYTVEHLAKLARVSPYKKDGKKKTKKSLINKIAKRSTGGLARLLGFKSGMKSKGKGRCKYGRKKTGRRGCRKKPGKKRGPKGKGTKECPFRLF